MNAYLNNLTICATGRSNDYEDIVFHNLSLLNWLSRSGQPFSIEWLAERWRVHQRVRLFTLQNLPHVPHLPPKYPHPNSHYKPHNTKAFMQCNDFATAVALEFVCGKQVRDPNVFAGTMGRYTSGPQGIVGTNYPSRVTMILIPFCDSDLSRRKTRIHYNDALLVSGFCS